MKDKVKGKNLKRLLCFMLTLAMVFTMLPMSRLTAYAESTTSYTVDFSYNGTVVSIDGGTRNYNLSSLISELGINEKITDIKVYDYSKTTVYSNNVVFKEENTLYTLFSIIKNTDTWQFNSMNPFDEEFVMVLSSSSNEYEVIISDATSHGVYLQDTENGTFSSDKSIAVQNATVTITTVPNTGFEVDTVSVKKRIASEDITVTDIGEGKYTFKMPSVDVNVTVTFKAKGFKPTDKVQVLSSMTLKNNHDGTIEFENVPTFVENTMNDKTVKASDLAWHYEMVIGPEDYFVNPEDDDTHLSGDSSSNEAYYAGSTAVNGSIDVSNVPFEEEGLARIAIVAITPSVVNRDNEPYFYGYQQFVLPTKVTYDLNSGTEGTGFSTEDWIIAGEEWKTTSGVSNHSIAPTKTGLVFDGWYTDKEGGTKIETTKEAVDSASCPTTQGVCSVTLYAHYVESPPHTHNWQYEEDGAKLTAKCTGDGDCTVTDGKTTGRSLTLSASTKTYDGTAVTATVGTEDEQKAWTNAGLTVPTDIKYYKATDKDSTTESGDALTSAPKDAGNYVAEVTVSDGKENTTNKATAKKAFSISKAELTIDTATIADKTYDGKKIATVNSVTFSGLKNDETLTKDTDYTVSGKFDKNDATGTNAATKVTVTVTLKDTATANNYTVSEKVFDKTISKATGTASVSMDNWTYGETAKDPVPTSTTNGTESVTYQYKVKDANDSTYTTTVPTNAGEYTVKATFAATDNYNEVSKTADFTIAKAKVEVPMAETGLVYNGTEQIGVVLPTDAKYTLSGNTDTNAGKHTATATLKDNTNYEWDGKNTSDDQKIEWSIAKKSITVTAEDKSSYIGDKQNDLTYKTEGLIGEDKITAGSLKLDKDFDNTKAGTFDIVEDKTFSAGDNYEIKFKKGTYTVKERPYIPSGGGAASETEKYTIPVKSEDTVQIGAEITDGSAKVEEITKESLETVVSKEENANDTVMIDLSGAKQDVTGVVITKKSVENLAETVKDETNKVDTVEIKMTNATVTLDEKTLDALKTQAQGDTIRLVVDETQAEKQLNQNQTEALSEKKVAQTFEAYFESNGQRIHDFNGGSATVAVKFAPETGRDAKYYHVYYASTDGKLQKYATKYENGNLKFTTGHFSDYAIVYDESEENATYAHTHDLTKVEAKAATADAEGNIEYYVCTKCGKYFSDAEGKNEITKESTVISKLTAPTVKVKAVRNLKVTAKGKTYVRVSWSKVSKAERYSVRVYRGGKRIAQNSTKNLTYKLTGLKKNTKYTIKVLAYNTQNGKKVYSNASEITVRTNK